MWRIAILSVTLTVPVGSIFAQTTKPGNGFALTDEEIRQRMDALNHKATTRPADNDEAAKAANRAAYAEVKQRQADLANNDMARAEAVIAQAAKELPAIEQQLAQVRSAGRAAEQELGQVLQRYNLTSMMAATAGRTTFSGKSETEVDGTISRLGKDNLYVRGRERTEFTGEIHDPTAQLAAIMAVEGRYGPELRQLRERVGELYQSYKGLMARRSQLVAASAAAMKTRARASRTYLNASKAVATVAGSATAAQGGTAETAAAWSQLRQMYPGVDVEAVWQSAVDEAADIIGADNPKLQELANKLFHDRATAAVQTNATSQPAR